MDGQPLTYDVTGAALELHVGKTKLREESQRDGFAAFESANAS